MPSRPRERALADAVLDARALREAVDADGVGDRLHDAAHDVRGEPADEEDDRGAEQVRDELEDLVGHALERREQPVELQRAEDEDQEQQPDHPVDGRADAARDRDVLLVLARRLVQALVETHSPEHLRHEVAQAGGDDPAGDREQCRGADLRQVAGDLRQHRVEGLHRAAQPDALECKHQAPEQDEPLGRSCEPAVERRCLALSGQELGDLLVDRRTGQRGADRTGGDRRDDPGRDEDADGDEHVGDGAGVLLPPVRECVALRKQRPGMHGRLPSDCVGPDHVGFRSRSLCVAAGRCRRLPLRRLRCASGRSGRRGRPRRQRGCASDGRRHRGRLAFPSPAWPAGTTSPFATHA